MPILVPVMTGQVDAVPPDEQDARFRPSLLDLYKAASAAATKSWTDVPWAGQRAIPKLAVTATFPSAFS